MTDPALLTLLGQLVTALETAPDWRLVELPLYERWYKGHRQEALHALRKYAAQEAVAAPPRPDRRPDKG